MRSPRAFTLIELLMAIAVVAVLAAILFPVFAKARESARRAVCASNMRQLGLATNAYLEDWDGRYPWAWDPELVHKEGRGPALRDVLMLYVQNQRVWECPSDIGETFPNGPNGRRERTPPFYDSRMQVGSSSYYYPGIGWEQRYLGQVGGVASAKLPRPSLIWWLSEFRPWHGPYRPTDEWSVSPGRYNLLYCDGHIAQRTMRQRGRDMVQGWAKPR
jgi:prepilin-type N-terminal cleavage/methylation domain-containing protein/prepilin-type processing-associated H-X9-DG protein